MAWDERIQVGVPFFAHSVTNTAPFLFWPTANGIRRYGFNAEDKAIYSIYHLNTKT
jgi:hypothetical protein